MSHHRGVTVTRGELEAATQRVLGVSSPDDPLDRHMLADACRAAGLDHDDAQAYAIAIPKVLWRRLEEVNANLSRDGLPEWEDDDEMKALIAVRSALVGLLVGIELGR